MSSRFFAGTAALAIILAVGQASAAAQDQSIKPAGKPKKASAGKLAVPVQPAPLGATVESVLAAGRRLNPALRAAALDTSAAAAKAAGADALDDPMISDSYQYYRNPNVFSGHVMAQAFPLWGKLDLREAALADLRSPEAKLHCPAHSGVGERMAGCAVVCHPTLRHGQWDCAGRKWFVHRSLQISCG